MLIYKKGSLCFNIQFFMDKIKKVKKKRKMAKYLTLPHGNLNPGFLNKTFPLKISILREIRSIELTVLKKSRLYCRTALKRKDVLRVRLEIPGIVTR